MPNELFYVQIGQAHFSIKGFIFIYIFLQILLHAMEKMQWKKGQ